MKKVIVFSFFFFFLANACKKEDEIKINCIDQFLEQNEMVKFQGQEIGCKFFLALYEFKKKQYFRLGNHCADLISFPTDCDGNKLCENGEEEECRNFNENAKYIGIIGIKE